MVDWTLTCLLVEIHKSISKNENSERINVSSNPLSEWFCSSRIVLATCFKISKTRQCSNGEFIPNEKSTIQGYGIEEANRLCTRCIKKIASLFFTIFKHYIARDYRLSLEKWTFCLTDGFRKYFNSSSVIVFRFYYY